MKSKDIIESYQSSDVYGEHTLMILWIEKMLKCIAISEPYENLRELIFTLLECTNGKIEHPYFDSTNKNQPMTFALNFKKEW